MFLIKFFTASFLILIILTSCSSEKESNPVLTVYKGTIKGFVYDATTNAPIYYAKISTDPPTKENYTGPDGEFVLNDILAGDYIVDAHRDGFDNDTTFITIQHKDTINTVFTLQDFSIYLDYYPLEIGNYWEYWTPNNPANSIEIVSDTIIGNVNYYVSIFRSFSSTYKETRFERIDTLNALVYRYFPLEEKEMIIDSLPAKQGQRFTSNMFLDWDVCSSYCSDIEEINIFSEIRKLRYLSHDCGQDLPWYQILKGIGLYSYGWPRPPGGVTLKYAIINGVEYGER
jgi:hypothetical protein